MWEKTVLLSLLAVGLVCLTEGRKGHNHWGRRCVASEEELEYSSAHRAIICYSGCCGRRVHQECCDPNEEGELYRGEDDDSRERYDDDEDEHHKAFKVITIVLGAVLGLVVVLAVVSIICRKRMMRKRRAAVPASLEPPSDKMKKYLADLGANNGKGEPCPPVEPQKPPAYVIAGVPPPVYNLGPHGMTAPGQAPPTAPPSYSTIDLQEAAGGKPVVQVRPAEDK